MIQYATELSSQVLEQNLHRTSTEQEQEENENEENINRIAEKTVIFNRGNLHFHKKYCLIGVEYNVYEFQSDHKKLNFF